MDFSAIDKFKKLTYRRNSLHKDAKNNEIVEFNALTCNAVDHSRTVDDEHFYERRNIYRQILSCFVIAICAFSILITSL